MKKLIPLIKENKIDVTFITISSILIFISFSNFKSDSIVDIIIPLFLCLISISFSIFFLSKNNEVKINLSKQKSAYSFFYCFINEIEKSTPIKSAYDTSSRYLISYQDIVPYDELDSNSLNIYKYQNYFSLILEKNKNNEAYLLNYRKLSTEIDITISKIETFEKSFLTKKRIIMSLFLVSIILLKTLIVILTENLTSSFSYYLTIFSLFSFCPLFYFLMKNIYKEIINV